MKKYFIKYGLVVNIFRSRLNIKYSHIDLANPRWKLKKCCGNAIFQKNARNDLTEPTDVVYICAV